MIDSDEREDGERERDWRWRTKIGGVRAKGNEVKDECVFASVHVFA